MKSKVFLTAFLALLGLLAGCIEFERQTMSYRHDSASDTLYVFQQYEGIFGVDNAGKLEQDELDQLASVLKGERTFFFNNWVTEFNRQALTEALAKPKGELDMDPALEEAYRAIARLALDSIKVENVGFYTNQTGRLCGAQRVTLRQVSKLVPALNTLLREFLRSEAAKDENPEPQKVVARKFLQRADPVLRLEGNRLELRWPITDADYREFYRSPQARAFRESGGIADHPENLPVLRLGEPKSQTVTLTLPFSEKPYAANAVSAAKEQGILKAFDPRKAAQDFLAVPPPKTP
jgi:hypothetical protein